FGMTDRLVSGTSSDPGIGVGVRVGYRAATIVGLEAMFEYRAQGAKGEVSYYDSTTNHTASSAEVSFTSPRLGGNLRLMTNGRVARFVATMGAGVAFDSVTWTGCDFCEDKSGPEFFAHVELGMEFEFNRFFFGAMLENMGSAIGQIRVDDNSPGI